VSSLETIRDRIVRAAFCAYIMAKENCDQDTALGIMTQLCVLCQLALGISTEEAFADEVKSNDD
jgi:hypothetical protein